MNRTMQMLGLAMRAGCVVTGEDRVAASVRSREAKILFIASDASRHQAKKMNEKARHYGIPVVSTFDRYTLGRAIGKGERVYVAVTEAGFAKQLVNLSSQT